MGLDWGEWWLVKVDWANWDLWKASCGDGFMLSD